MEVENFSRASENIPMDVTSDASEKTIICSESEADSSLKSEENRSLLYNDNTDKNFITWENNSNICWLDASMALLVHNQTMRRVIKLYPDCQVSQIINGYDDAISTLNDLASGKDAENRLNTAREKLLKVQESSLTYLQPLIKCKKGEPDSAFCSLLNLIKEEKIIQSYFDVTYAWVRQCEKCEMPGGVNNTKPIITITFIDKFVPENLISSNSCYSCGKKDQKMKLVYKKLPACLIFNFENGAGDGTEPLLSFLIESREYQLTGIIVFEKSKESNVNHFVTYIRYPSVNKWLECNDLNTDVTSFSTELPNFSLKDVYIYVYEAFDNLGTIDTKEDSVINNSNQNIPCIIIDDELDAVTNICKDKAAEKIDVSEPEENIENITAFLSKPFNQNSKDYLDSKIKSSNLCDDSKLIMHKNNTEKKILPTFTEENNVDMKGIPEPKSFGKSRLNQISENIKFDGQCTYNYVSSQDWFKDISARIPKDSSNYENSKNTNSNLTFSDVNNSTTGNQSSHMPKNIENTGFNKTLSVETVQKCENKVLNTNSTIENTKGSLRVDKNYTLSSQNWLKSITDKFSKDGSNYENSENTHSPLSDVNNSSGNQSSHMSKNIENTCSTKTLSVEAVKKCGNEVLNTNSTIENTKKSSQVNKSCTGNVVFEESNLGETSNSGMKIGFRPKDIQISSAKKDEVNENAIDKQNAKIDNMNSKIPYIQEKCHLMLADKVNRSENSENLTGKIQIAVTQKEDSRNCNSNLISSQVLDKQTKKTCLKSKESSWILHSSASNKETSVSLIEEIVNLNTQSSKKKSMKKSLFNKDKCIDKKESINVQDSNKLNLIELEIASPNKDKDKMKLINLVSNDQCGKKMNLLHDAPFKPYKERSFSPHTSNYLVSGKEKTVLGNNSGTSDKQLLLRMQKASLKKPNNLNSESSCYVYHGTGSSKSENFPDIPKHSVTPETDKIKVQSRVKKRNLQAKFKPSSHRSSPMQSLLEEIRISNTENAPDMDFTNVSCNVTTQVEREVSTSNNMLRRMSHANSRSKRSVSIPINERAELKQTETSMLSFSDNSMKSIKSQTCSLIDNAHILKDQKDFSVNKQRSESSPEFKKRIIKSPMRYSAYTSKNEKVSDMSVPSCSYSVEVCNNKVPKQKQKIVSCLKNRSQNFKNYQNMEENDSHAFSEEEMIKRPKRRKTISDDNERSSAKPKYQPILHKKSCKYLNCRCKEEVTVYDAIDTISDIMFFMHLEAFNLI